MNVLPYCGYFFYGATDTDARASYFCSYGLLKEAPEGEIETGEWLILGNVLTGILRNIL